jgi:hypothetical protein
MLSQLKYLKPEFAKYYKNHDGALQLLGARLWSGAAPLASSASRRRRDRIGGTNFLWRWLYGAEVLTAADELKPEADELMMSSGIGPGILMYANDTNFAEADTDKSGTLTLQEVTRVSTSFVLSCVCLLVRVAHGWLRVNRPSVRGCPASSLQTLTVALGCAARFCALAVTASRGQDRREAAARLGGVGPNADVGHEQRRQDHSR